MPPKKQEAEEPKDIEEPKEQKPKVTLPTGVELIEAEREFRRYWKRSGGLRKGLGSDKIPEAKRLARLLGRNLKDEDNPPKWDESVVVPGIDISHAELRNSQE